MILLLFYYFKDVIFTDETFSKDNKDQVSKMSCVFECVARNLSIVSK